MVIEAAPFYDFVKGDGGFVCTLPWCPAFGPEKLFRFHMLPGVPEGLTFKVPCDAVGKAVQVSVQSTAKESFTVFQLLQKAGDEIATTEPVLDGPLIIDDDDEEWVPLDGSWTATRTSDGFIVKLSASHDERLTGGAEVRFTKADGCDIAEVITRLPLVLEPDIVLEIPVNLSSQKEEETVSGLEVRQPPSVAQVSTEKPPIPEATALLDFGATGFMVSTSARNGDCFITSSMCGRELTVEEVQKPTMDTLDAISEVRESVFDLLVGDTIGGLDAALVREHEKIPASKQEASLALSDWKTQGFWHCPEGENLSAFFLFGLSVKLGRPLLVFEVDAQGDYNADARLYGAIDTDGSLRRTTKEPITIHSYYTLPHASAIAMLTKDVSALRYDRSALHFDPILKQEATLATEAPAPQPPVAKEAPVVETVAKMTVEERKEAREKEAAERKEAKAREVAERKAAREKEVAERKAAREKEVAERKEAREKEAREKRAAREKAAEEKAAAKEKAAQEKAAAKEKAAQEKAVKPRAAQERPVVKKKAVAVKNRPNPSTSRPSKAKKVLPPTKSGRKRSAPPPDDETPVKRVATTRVEHDRSVPDYAIPGSRLWAKGYRE